MTVWIRDASNFDTSLSFAGLSGFTHKATEGISVVHDRYGPRLNAARAAGVPVLGAYHVLRTPGAANGSLAAQLNFWIGYLDATTPWWRDHPHFILQIDAERWSYDNVQPGTVLNFAAEVVTTVKQGWKVTYASRGQYGDSLRGIATPLWNADYRDSNAGTYPGDGWTSYRGQPAGWAPYSGQTPVFLQFTDTPYDYNAFPGSQTDLLNTVDTIGASVDTVITWNTGWMMQRYFEDADPVVVPPNASIGAPGFSIPNIPKQRQAAAVASTNAAIAGLKAALTAVASANGANVDTGAVLAQVDRAVAGVDQVHQELAATKEALAAAQTEITQLRGQLAATELSAT
jgi:glycosyl hydrolase family 25